MTQQDSAKLASGTSSNVAIRPVRPTDVPAVVAMVHELAEYERAPERCRLTDGQLHTALFGELASRSNEQSGELASRSNEQSGELASRSNEHPALFGHVAVDPDTDEPLGFGLWFLNFSTWEGVHGIYLEDLYVRPTARGTGAGRALLSALAALCLERGYRRLEWRVLNWNPARDFYAAIGAVAMDQWVPYRIEGEPLRSLAVERRGSTRLGLIQMSAGLLE